MRKVGSRPLSWLAACGAAAAAVASPAAASQADYDRAREVGLRAYKYGLPLVVMDRTFRNQTSVNVPNGRGFGPVNHFNHVRRLADPDDRSVVAPNTDTLYSMAWLDLRREPQVLHVPLVRGRFFVLPLMDPYTENFQNLGSASATLPGDYVITGPGQDRVRLPRGTRRVQSRYSRVWIVGRTLVRGQSDIGDVNKVQAGYRLTPLSRYGTAWRPRRPRHRDTTVDDPALPTGLAWFDRLGEELRRFPPPPADAPALADFAAFGIGPGRRPSRDPSLSADTRRGLADAVAAGPGSITADLRSLALSGFVVHNGWVVLPTGAYGTNYTLRAIIAQVGLGALRTSEAIYALTTTDLTAQTLTGRRRYGMHIPAGALPPVRAFWSLTLYDGDGFFAPNPIHRYLINDRTPLHFNADGSLDITVQRTAPTDPGRVANWLPAPPGPFRLIWRLYATRPDAVAGVLDGSGWDPPAVMPCVLPEALRTCPPL